MSDVAPDDRDLAIRTMLGEEGSEAGQAGVAAVILNRLAAGSYGGSIGDVVLAPHQFEAWTRQTDDLLTIKRNDPRYVEAGQIFDAVRSGAIPDPTDGATHFYAPVAQAALGRKSPDWAKGQGLKLGSSMFYAPQGRVERKPDVPQTQPVPPAQPGAVTPSPQASQPESRCSESSSGVPEGCDAGVQAGRCESPESSPGVPEGCGGRAEAGRRFDAWVRRGRSGSIFGPDYGASRIGGSRSLCTIGEIRLAPEPQRSLAPGRKTWRAACCGNPSLPIGVRGLAGASVRWRDE